MVHRKPSRFEYIRNEIRQMVAEDPLAAQLAYYGSMKEGGAAAQFGLYLLWLRRDPKRLGPLYLFSDTLHQMARTCLEMAKQGRHFPSFETFVRRLREMELGPEQFPNLVATARVRRLEEVM